MNLITFSLQKPITVLVLVAGLVLGSVVAVTSINIDIFPKLNLPVIYVIEPYAGMTPQQMEGIFSTRLQDQFLYINGIKNISSKNLQGISILKLTFFESTNMAEASAQLALQLNRAMQFFPPGALPPQVIRFDASSLPVGSLVFSSADKSLEEVADLAATKIRPMFSSIAGVATPAPIGANQRSVLVNIDPVKLRSYNLTPDEIVAAVAANNIMAPSGTVSFGNTVLMTTTNALEKNIKDFGDIPIKSQGATTLYIHDIGTVKDASDLTTGYALINGKRSVYMPVVKTPDASTLQVVSQLKAKIPEMQQLLPPDVQIEYVFDQSVFVMNAVKNLMNEGITGALLTGIVVLLFLKDWRSCLIVVINIPLSVLSAVLCLQLFGQTINIMTLSGLALAIGILVDEATVTIENIHRHTELGKEKKLAIYDACQEISFSKLLILLCILAVFAPSLVMQGIPRALFLPLSLSIAFAMIFSFLLSQSLVPIIANWMLKDEHTTMHVPAPENSADNAPAAPNLKPMQQSFIDKLKLQLNNTLQRLELRKKTAVTIYLATAMVLIGIGWFIIGKEMLPASNNGQYQLKLKLPDGTRYERTEEMVQRVLSVLDSMTGGHNKITSAYAGMVPVNNATANLFVFNSGYNEATLQVQTDDGFKMDKDRFQELLRQLLQREIPQIRLSFEPIELTEKIMSQGAATPIEVQIAGKDMQQIQDYGEHLMAAMGKVSFFRDIQVEQPLRCPTLRIVIDRTKVSQMGLRLQDVSRSVTAFTSSSRFIEKNLWLDTKSAYTFQVQAQVQSYLITELDALKRIPLDKNNSGAVLENVATFEMDTSVGEYDRTGPRRFITVSANLFGKDLQSGTDAVNRAIASLGAPPMGLTVEVHGMSNLLTATLGSLQNGLLVAVVAIFLLLAANYQSFKVAAAVLCTIPAVLLGSIASLLLTGCTLNLQSYMGVIMSCGVSVANAILVVTNAERLRFEYNNDVCRAARESAVLRLRPIMMTSLSMIAGMLPMAMGMGEAGEQSAPLGRAVIGGLTASTFAALFIVPICYMWVQQHATAKSGSLLPERIEEQITSSI
jgi:multidrug efflux pump subunit AcrB